MGEGSQENEDRRRPSAKKRGLVLDEILHRDVRVAGGGPVQKSLFQMQSELYHVSILGPQHRRLVASCSIYPSEFHGFVLC